VRDLVVSIAHWPTAPVMTMEDAPTSSRSGFAVTFSEEITEQTCRSWSDKPNRPPVADMFKNDGTVEP
jgi:hypothetical protein